MQLTFTAQVATIAREPFRVPGQYLLRPVNDDDWTQLAALYFVAYSRSIVESLAAAVDEMQRTRAGEYGILANALSPVTTTLHNTIVGAILTVWQAPWPDTPKGIFIIEVFTHPHQRGVGLARAGLIWLARQAHAQGFDTLALRVGADNPSAIALYRSLGFTDWQNVV